MSKMSSALACKDPRSAIEWLERAFGFQTTMLIEDDTGKLVHSELRFGDGLIMVGDEWADNIKAPASVGGSNTQTIHIELSEGIDAHCERARAAGAKIVAEPEDQFYGDRTYRAIDPEGHMWTFSQRVQEMTTQEMEAAAPGLKITTAE